jgi:hypothetical protein
MLVNEMSNIIMSRGFGGKKKKSIKSSQADSRVEV